MPSTLNLETKRLEPGTLHPKPGKGSGPLRPVTLRTALQELGSSLGYQIDSSGVWGFRVFGFRLQFNVGKNETKGDVIIVLLDQSIEHSGPLCDGLFIMCGAYL